MARRPPVDGVSTIRARLGLRQPVRREGAEHYLFLTLISFAGTVMATRVYLEMTGYPRIGGGELHIAHALFGGFFLFVAALLPILLAGRRVYRVAAVLGGVGIVRLLLFGVLAYRRHPRADTRALRPS